MAHRIRETVLVLFSRFALPFWFRKLAILFFLSNPRASRPRSHIRIYTLCTQILGSASRDLLIVGFPRYGIRGSSSRSRHGVARLLVHWMWHSGRARHVLLHLWAGTGAGTAVELLPFRVAHVRWPAGNV
jgi:hypothetical protein